MLVDGREPAAVGVAPLVGVEHPAPGGLELHNPRIRSTSLLLKGKVRWSKRLEGRFRGVRPLPPFLESHGGLVNTRRMLDGKPRHGGERSGCRWMTGAPGGPPQVLVPGTGWVTVASQAITAVGFPVVVAGFLLWYVVFKFGTTIEVIGRQMQANADLAGKLIQTEQLTLVELQKQTQELHEQTQLIRLTYERKRAEP